MWLNSAMKTIFLILLSAICPLQASFYDQIPVQIKRNAPYTGVAILDRGQESLLARAWLTTQVKKQLDLAYFIWAHDNVGILASNVVLQAAERGIQIRVLLDDLMIDTNPQNLLCLNAHPNVEIKIYNPQHKVGLTFKQRLYRIFTRFRQSNQRMHDKLFIADGQIAMTGGRNIADEYYDYDHEFNFRDRDILVAGPTAVEMQKHFDIFWNHPLSQPVENLLPELQKKITADIIKKHRSELAAYAADENNFAPEVKTAINGMENKFRNLFNS